MISKNDVEHVANLARLSLSQDEVDKFTTQLDQIISMEDELSQVETEGVKPTTHITDEINVFREDVPVDDGITRDDLLSNVPETKDGLIKVPSIIDKGETDA
ncbi:Asp-tRNA(Asn)/Glu-tRNA(Gln) amidotransferase subunit GatC [Lapidilactobacillus bayanensis]|uniref:Asp-tRNA(Asn)/Glu-tRNA(Gln) amidotransferase subunit GatC n=1 Tax=Lapidilactobacillus bayanensis TaxID=2485998 RepID=UPI00177DEC5B|nr:Asp-tRNA(Asn)/Glu-tRNA(Gln) amidotransferase subunit GatC [Lapidilactobacillus bayanensis]